jgi:hypothetical protein
VERFAVRVASRGAVLEAEDLMREVIRGAISRQLGNAIIKALLLFGRLTDLLRDGHGIRREGCNHRRMRLGCVQPGVSEVCVSEVSAKESEVPSK